MLYIMLVHHFVIIVDKRSGKELLENKLVGWLADNVEIWYFLFGIMEVTF